MHGRRRVKVVIKRAYKRVLRVPGRLMRGTGCRILTYHNVGSRDHDMNVAPADFELQMRWLAENECVLSIADAVQRGEGVALTFDDGYRDNLTNAAPVLRSLNLPATFFVITGPADGRPMPDDDETGGLMTWDEIRRLQSMGFDIGGHSMTHARLAALSEDQQRQEILGCAQLLEHNLAHPATTFAYPFGSAADYDQTSVRLARQAGFRYAFSNQYGLNREGADPWNLKRIWVDGTDSLESFKAKVDGRLDLLCVLESGPGIRARRLLNSLLRVR